MKNSNGQSARPDPADQFRRRRQDLDELITLSQEARALLRTRAIDSFQRLSDFLDEVLPADPKRASRLARAVSLEPSALNRLRRGELDPVRTSHGAIAQLLQALGIDRGTLRRLVAADHAKFGTVVSRGADTLADDDWQGLEAALDRLDLDSPTRVVD